MANNQYHDPSGIPVRTANVDTPATEASPAGPDGDPERVLHRIRDCLRQLDEPGRDLIRMKFVEGLNYRQVSERTGLSVRSVGRIVHDALRRVATDLEEGGIKL